MAPGDRFCELYETSAVFGSFTLDPCWQKVRPAKANSDVAFNVWFLVSPLRDQVDKWGRKGQRTRARGRTMTLTSQVKNPACTSSWHSVVNHQSRRLSTFPFSFLTGPSCRHIKKGTEQTLLKKLCGNSNWTSCQDCSNDENKENVKSDSQEEQETQVAWLCLKCGHRVSPRISPWPFLHRFEMNQYLLWQGCGRYSENQHAIRHYETPRSDPHCLVINLDTWIVWWVRQCRVCSLLRQVCVRYHFFFMLLNSCVCVFLSVRCYICDDEVQYSKTGHLAQLISKLQKEASAHPIKTAQKSTFFCFRTFITSIETTWCSE